MAVLIMGRPGNFPEFHLVIAPAASTALGKKYRVARGSGYCLAPLIESGRAIHE
jgi:hypothetical protein